MTRRGTHVQFRASEAEKARMRELAAAAGFDELSEYCRAMALWDPRGGEGSVEVRAAGDALEVRRGPAGDWLHVEAGTLEAAGWVRASIEGEKPEPLSHGV